MGCKGLTRKIRFKANEKSIFDKKSAKNERELKKNNKMN
jgi:hypothetical protein